LHIKRRFACGTLSANRVHNKGLLQSQLGSLFLLLQVLFQIFTAEKPNFH
jgi:hypothetical protein